MRKALVFMFLGLSFWGCKSVKVTQVEKLLVSPGIRRAVPYHRYMLTIKSTFKSCSFTKITTQGGLLYTEFSVKDEKGIMASNASTFPAGNYELIFKNENELIDLSPEEVSVFVTTKSGKTLKINAYSILSEKQLR